MTFLSGTRGFAPPLVASANGATAVDSAGATTSSIVLLNQAPE